MGQDEMYRATKTLVIDNRLLLVLSVVAYALLCYVVILTRSEDVLTSGVVAWWTVLCAISVFNICGWRVSAAAVERGRGYTEPDLYRFQRWQLMLSAVYVFGCGFRAVLPRADVQRIGLWDSWLSSVMVGRSVATVAEVCFIIQCALLLNKYAREAGSRFGVVVSWMIVPMIVMAEICSWYAVLTTCYLGNAIEESLWTTSVTLVLLSCLALWPRCRSACRPFLAAAMVLGVAYVMFMATVDVPMYLTRWMADEASGRTYLTVSQGLQDVWARRSVTFDWEAWRTEVPWMTLYFSVAVWWSIALAHAPRVTERATVAA